MVTKFLTYIPGWVQKQQSEFNFLAPFMLREMVAGIERLAGKASACSKSIGFSG